ncbi:conjugal transfer protein [Enterococcus sp. UD-01]|jgi:hypothetical protein|uniref:conjugal transfer protein n=1 Tax=Enterococcus sp. UD-01 TaxID=3373911 RepID=UPI0038351AFD
MRFIKERKIARPAKPKEEKTGSIRLFRLLFLSLLTFLIISGPIGYLKANKMQANITKEQAMLTKEIQKTLTTNQSQTSTVSELYKHFLEPFISLYINIPSEQQAFEERQANLQTSYFSFEIEEETNNGSERKLKNNSFYDVITKDGQAIAQYRVTYEVVSPVVKEKEVKKKEGAKEVTTKEKYTDYETSEHQTLLNIPFKEYPDGSFKVTSYPYFSNEPTLTTGKVLEEGMDKSSYGLIKNQQNKDMQAFVQAFLEKYVSVSTEEMAYLMKEPETLNGEYTVENIQTENYAKEKQLISFVSFEVYDKATKTFHKENMTLLLKQRDNTYFIEKMTHYLGGID